MPGYGTYFWFCRYNDGTVVTQPPFDKVTGKGTNLNEVDFNRVVELGWLPFSGSKGVKPVTVNIDPSWQRGILLTNAGFQWLPVRKELDRVFMVGWQATVEGKNIRNVLYILPSGEVISSGEVKPNLSKWLKREAESYV
jgi:hypothetical protein